MDGTRKSFRAYGQWWLQKHGARRGRLVLTRGGAPQEGLTPLYIAADQGNEAVAQVLLHAGARKDATDQVRAKRGRGWEG